MGTDIAPVVSTKPTKTHNGAGPIARRRRPRFGVVGWLYAAPTAAVVGLLFVLPIALAIWMSLNDWPLIGTPEFNFPENYAKIPSDDLFIQGITFTFLYALIITVTLMCLAMVLALLV